MSSTFKNRIPRRKYRERAQPEARQGLGILQKKQDYRQRANNYRQKQAMLDKFKLKAATRNEQEFYFKMNRGKKNEDGKHVEFAQDSDSEFDQQKYRAVLKTENYSLALLQQSIVAKKINRLRSQLQLLSEKKSNRHLIFAQSEEELNNFEPEKYFGTRSELIDSGMLEANPQFIEKTVIDSAMLERAAPLKDKYTRLSEYEEKAKALSKILEKLAYQKGLLSKERKMIKKSKTGKKIHKFFLQRKT